MKKNWKKILLVAVLAGLGAAGYALPPELIASLMALVGA